MTGVALCLLILGGGALVGQAAKRRGRSFVGWTVIASFLSATAYFIVYALAFDSKAGQAINTAAALSVFLAPSVALVGLAALVRRLGFRTRNDRWKVFAIRGSERAEECDLLVRRGEVQLAGSSGAPEVIALSTLERARADCECVRLQWRDGNELRELVLQIVLPNAEWEIRARLAESAAAAISTARRRDGQAKNGDTALPRAQSMSRP